MEGYICTNCLKSVARGGVRVRRMFLGGGRFVCPHCEAAVAWPLSMGYRLLYWCVGGFLPLSPERQCGSPFNMGDSAIM